MKMMEVVVMMMAMMVLTMVEVVMDAVVMVDGDVVHGCGCFMIIEFHW